MTADEMYEKLGLRTVAKHTDGSRKLEGDLTPELVAKLVNLTDLLTIHEVMDEKPLKLTLTVPEVLVEGVAEALHEDPNRKRRPKHVIFEGNVYVPKEPTQFWCGKGTWHHDEDSFVVRKGQDFPEAVIVACLDDPQIVFPPAERWVLQTRYHRLSR